MQYMKKHEYRQCGAAFSRVHPSELIQMRDRRNIKININDLKPQKILGLKNLLVFKCRSLLNRITSRPPKRFETTKYKAFKFIYKL